MVQTPILSINLSGAKLLSNDFFLQVAYTIALLKTNRHTHPPHGPQHIIIKLTLKFVKSLLLDIL